MLAFFSVVRVSAGTSPVRQEGNGCTAYVCGALAIQPPAPGWWPVHTWVARARARVSCVLLSNRCLAQDKWLQGLVVQMERDDTVGAAASVAMDTLGQLVYTGMDFHLSQTALDRYLPMPFELYAGFPYSYAPASVRSYPVSATGCNGLLVRSSTLQQSLENGAFNRAHKLGGYLTCVDLSLRLAKKGLRVQVVPASVYTALQTDLPNQPEESEWKTFYSLWEMSLVDTYAARLAHNATVTW